MLSFRIKTKKQLNFSVPYRNFENNRVINKITNPNINPYEEAELFTAINALTTTREKQKDKAISLKTTSIKRNIFHKPPVNVPSQLFHSLAKSTKHLDFLKNQFITTFSSHRDFSDDKTAILVSNMRKRLTSNLAEQVRKSPKKVSVQDRSFRFNAEKALGARSSDRHDSSINKVKKSTFKKTKTIDVNFKSVAPLQIEARASRLIETKLRKDFLTKKSIRNTAKMNNFDLKKLHVRITHKDKSLKEVKDKLIKNMERSERLNVSY